MKKWIFLLGVIPSLYAADNQGPLSSKSVNDMFKKEQQTIQKSVNQQALAATIKPEEPKSLPAISGVMIVNPETIAADWKTAFNLLAAHAVGKVVFRLADGSELTNVTSLEPLQGGYLLLLTLQGLQGKQFQIIKTSDIISLLTQ